MPVRSTLAALSCVALILGSQACSNDVQSQPTAPGLTTTTIPAVTYDAVYVVNGGDATISVINTEKNEVAGTIALTGVAYPHHASLSPDRTLVGVAVPGYDMSMGEFGHQHHSSRPGRVVLLDALTGALRGDAVTAAANNNVVFSREGHQVWTSMATTPGSTLVLDVDSMKIADAMSVGTAPAETQITEDGTLAFVANSGSSSVSVIDVAQRRVQQTINVGAGPVLALPSKDGRVYVENEPDQTISVIDRASLTVTNTFSIGYKPGSMAVWPTGGVGITAPDRGEVEIRTHEGNVVQTIATGKGAHWMIFSKDNKRCYVSNQYEDTVSVIDMEQMKAVATIKVGSQPNGMVWRSR